MGLGSELRANRAVILTAAASLVALGLFAGAGWEAHALRHGANTVSPDQVQGSWQTLDTSQPWVLRFDRDGSGCRLTLEDFRCGRSCPPSNQLAWHLSPSNDLETRGVHIDNQWHQSCQVWVSGSGEFMWLSQPVPYTRGQVCKRVR